MKLGKINFKKLATNVYFAKKDKVLYIFDEDVNNLFNLSHYPYLPLQEYFQYVDKQHIEPIKDEVETLCICQWIKYDFPEECPEIDLARFAETFPKLSTIIHSSSIEIQNVPQHVKVLECFDLWDMIREAEGKGRLREAEFYCILEGATDTAFGTLQYAEFLERQARFAEAEKQYLLACQCDHPGDPLAAYGRFLAGQGRYAESLESLRDTWEGYYDTMPREAAICFLEDQLDNPASPFWNLLDHHEFHDMLERYVARGGKKVDEIISSRAENAVGTDYIVEDGVLKKYTGQKAYVTIPNDGSITSLGKGCFANRETLRSVTIPESVTSLGKNCFANCENLESITIPVSVTSLGENCFENCENLTIFAAKGSYAAKCAKENGTKFKAI